MLGNFFVSYQMSMSPVKIMLNRGVQCMKCKHIILLCLFIYRSKNNLKIKEITNYILFFFFKQKDLTFS